MNILITGGAGFIGSHLCKRFIDAGHRVICLDNFITGSKENTANLIDKSNFTLVEHDIAKAYISSVKLDWVFHFASLASPKDYLNYPLKTLESGLFGTYNCLNTAKEHNAKFFFSSTSEVYGDPLQHPQTEEYWGNVNPIGARSCYDESKRGGEAIIYAFWRQYKIDIRVVRIFNTYGSNMRINDGRVISNFIVQALRNEDITVYGSGSQTRSFCYVDDLIDGIVKLMDIDYRLPINLGNPDEYTVAELARKIIALTGSKSKLIYLPLPEDDPVRRRPDIAKAKKFLEWIPKIKLDEGLMKTIIFFKKRYGK